MATQKRRKKKKKNLTGGELLAFRVLMTACAVLLCVSTVRNLTAGGAKKNWAIFPSVVCYGAITENIFNIEEISNEVGWESSKRFRDVFKEFEGISPNEYRKNGEKD